MFCLSVLSTLYNTVRWCASDKTSITACSHTESSGALCGGGTSAQAEPQLKEGGQTEGNLKDPDRLSSYDRTDYVKKEKGIF